jgi:peptide/nickel transport system permease protein
VLFHKNKYISSSSLSDLAWKKFRKDKAGYGSLIFICIVTMTALLGYLITPDHTPFANDQCIELGTQKPGFTVTMLLIRKNEDTAEPNLIKTMLFGKPAAYQSIPLDHYHFEGASIVIEGFGQHSAGQHTYSSFNMADVIYSASNDTLRRKVMNGLLVFRDGKGLLRSEPISSLHQRIVKNNIIKRTYLLGTDRFGRDLLSQLMIGTRVSLSVGLISVFISLVIGIFIGSAGGFFRGWIDNIVVWFINVVWSIPTLLLVIAITFALGKGFWQVFVAVGLTMWVEVARVVRGQILIIREKEFVEAGRALGYSNLRIIFRHILPNIMGIVIVISAANFASAILMEAGLSFLGIGVQPPMPSWGSMIKENYGYIILDSAYLAILPGIAIMLMVLAFMLIGNALRDALDVKTSEF